MPRSYPVADEWFARDLCAPGLVRIWEPFVHPLMQANIWHVRGAETDLIVDAGMGAADLAGALRAWGLGGRPVLLLVTHCHADHAGGAHQFWPRAVHRAEAQLLAHPPRWRPLLAADYPIQYHAYFLDDERDDDLAAINDALVISRLPSAGFDPAQFTVPAATPTLHLQEGDQIDLGDRLFSVLHLPGHSPGSIGLWDEATGALFSGDVIYDEGSLLDDLEGSCVADYVASLERLRELPVQVVYAGHGLPFGRDLLRRRIDDYMRRRRP